MRPIPLESLEPSSRKKQPKKKAYPRNFKLSPDQLKAKSLARRLEQYALDSKSYSPHQVNALIADVRESVIRINIQRNSLRSRNPQTRRKPKKNLH